MDSMSAFAMGQAARGNTPMVFDWVKAANLIKEHKPKEASAGLAGDWEYTGGVIYTADGIPDEDGTYLCSTWATPELDMDGIVQDCYVMQSERPEWHSHTFWPPEALEILGQQARGTTIDVDFVEIAGELDADIR